jgi:hypothetical protein
MWKLRRRIKTPLILKTSLAWCAFQAAKWTKLNFVAHARSDQCGWLCDVANMRECGNFGFDLERDFERWPGQARAPLRRRTPARRPADRQP